MVHAPHFDEVLVTFNTNPQPIGDVMTKSINRSSTIAEWTFEPGLAASPVFAQVTRMSTGERAINILRELHAAEEELVGKAVVLTDGKTGTIEHVYLDDVHVLRISIGGHDRRWPISTVKFIDDLREYPQRARSEEKDPLSFLKGSDFSRATRARMSTDSQPKASLRHSVIEVLTNGSALRELHRWDTE
jgi:hypothetical protein